MGAIIGAITGFLGISSLRLYIYLAVTVAIIIAGFTVRQHYINKGWYAHAAKIEKQDNIAVDAARKVEQKTSACSDANGYWDVITQNCKLEGAE
jgi:hypothetical protein